ncbi:hypothetical protein, partial [Pseudoalteromonas sp. BSi20495]|uniref:hypothetical protein n=1 Tax=Pseudoalteromonas sp. BSi20495 TaxID=386429 RepID=UPI000519119C
IFKKRGVKPHLQHMPNRRCEFTSRSCNVALMFKKRGVKPHLQHMPNRRCEFTSRFVTWLGV